MKINKASLHHDKYAVLIYNMVLFDFLPLLERITARPCFGRFGFAPCKDGGNACKDGGKAIHHSMRDVMMTIFLHICQCIFQLGKKCPFEKSENQFFCPKKINFDFNGLHLWIKTGFVAL